MIFIPKKGVGTIEETVTKICYGGFRVEGSMPWAITVGIMPTHPGPEPDGAVIGFALMKTRDGYFYYESMEKVEVQGRQRHLRVFL